MVAIQQIAIEVLGRKQEVRTGAAQRNSAQRKLTFLTTIEIIVIFANYILFVLPTTRRTPQETFHLHWQTFLQSSRSIAVYEGYNTDCPVRSTPVLRRELFKY